MNCDVCDKQKNELKNTRSTVISLDYYACSMCQEAGFEPRHFLLLAYMQGNDDQKDRALIFIKQKKYTGKEITLAEAL